MSRKGGGGGEWDDEASELDEEIEGELLGEEMQEDTFEIATVRRDGMVECNVGCGVGVV
jgi:hypothetical protein